MSSFSVIVNLDVLKNRSFCLSSTGKYGATRALFLQHCSKTLNHRVVVAIPFFYSNSPGYDAHAAMFDTGYWHIHGSVAKASYRSVPDLYTVFNGSPKTRKSQLYIGVYTKRIERAVHRDPVGAKEAPTAPVETSKCSFLGPIGVTIQQFQESGFWHVECQNCGARRDMKKVKDRQKFPPHPPRKTPPPN